VLAKPASLMPMQITGGKGSGKTHLMRYLSFSNQLLRHGDNIEKLIAQDRYIGIYVRFSGLNASRFSRKGQSDDVWADVFSFYTELWLGQLMLETFANLARLSQSVQEYSSDVVANLVELFTVRTEGIVSLTDLRTHLQGLQRTVDHAVNNCGLSGSLDVEICLNRGSMIFEAPRRIARTVPLLRNSVFLYLLDEFENLDTLQQRYVNTLVREKEAPATVKIGAKSYGIRTYATLSGGEELREGSEFEELPLDDRLRRSPRYDGFCRQMVAKRLNEVFRRDRETEPMFDASSLDQHFASVSQERFLPTETEFVLERYIDAERPYFSRLREKLIRARSTGGAPGVYYDTDIDFIIETLRSAELPLAEKVNVLLLYRAWSRGQNMRKAAVKISDALQQYLSAPRRKSEYKSAVDKFQYDLFAQLLRECKQKQRYSGIETFIQMSAGLPRNLLVILKHIFSWAEFRDERPFRGRPLSIEAQQLGVIDAAEWFLKDARIPGKHGQSVHEAVRRLAELFRAIRFSDKPSECSLVTFSTNTTALSERSWAMLQLSYFWSLLIRVPGGQKDRNTPRVDDKYQLNPMLAPLWQLPVSRRGAIALDPSEVETIFASNKEAFEEVLHRRVSRMQAPFGRGAREQGTLFGAEDD